MIIAQRNSIRCCIRYLLVCTGVHWLQIFCPYWPILPILALKNIFLETFLFRAPKKTVLKSGQKYSKINVKLHEFYRSV